MTVTTTWVLYHKNCLDGTAAAWCDYKLNGKYQKNTNYIGVRHGDHLPKLVKEGDDLVLLDFTYPVEEMIKSVPLKTDILIIDHHEHSAERIQAIKDTGRWHVESVFDKNKSGAVLAFEHYFPEKEVPKLLLLIQDRDLWSESNPLTDNVISGLRSFPGIHRLEVFDRLVSLDDEGKAAKTLRQLWEKGGVINDIRNQVVATYSRVGSDKLFITDFLGHRVGWCNVVAYISDIGNAIVGNKKLDVDVAIMYYLANDSEGNPRFNFELRSSKKGSNVDVGAIAVEMGGGGHRNASGFQLSFLEGSKFLAAVFG